jgi:hypothetical protein
MSVNSIKSSSSRGENKVKNYWGRIQKCRGRDSNPRLLGAKVVSDPKRSPDYESGAQTKLGYPGLNFTVILFWCGFI